MCDLDCHSIIASVIGLAEVTPLRIIINVYIKEDKYSSSTVEVKQMILVWTWRCSASAKYANFSI